MQSIQLMKFSRRSDSLRSGFSASWSCCPGAVFLVPFVGAAIKRPAGQVAFLITCDLLACGIASLLQSVGVWRFGIRLPVIMGVTFAAVGPMVADRI